MKKRFFQTKCSQARSETFTNMREVCNRFCLPPGEYLIVPSTYEPDHNADFYLRVFTEKQADFQYVLSSHGSKKIQLNFSKKIM